MIEAFMIWAMGIMDHSRGDGNIIPKLVDQLMYGLAAAVLIVGTGLSIDLAAIAVLFAVGSSFGWGEPLGAVLDGRKMNQDNLESWQVGPLKSNAWLALLARGALWGVPLLAWMPIVHEVWVVVPAYAVAMPLAVLISKRTGGDWVTQEYYRGWIGGTLIWLLGSGLI